MLSATNFSVYSLRQGTRDRKYSDKKGLAQKQLSDAAIKRKEVTSKKSGEE